MFIFFFKLKKLTLTVPNLLNLVNLKFKIKKKNLEVFNLAYIYIAGSRLGPVQNGSSPLASRLGPDGSSPGWVQRWDIFLWVQNGSSQERSRDGIYFMGSGMVPVMKEVFKKI